MARILWAAEYHPTCCYPAMPIALELQQRGHDVSVLAPARMQFLFERFGFEFQPNARFPEEDFRSEAAPFLPDEEFVSARFWSWWRERNDDQFADTAHLLSQQRFDLVLTKACLMLYGSGFAAEKFGIPWVSYVHFCFDETIPLPAESRSRWDLLRARASIGSDPRPAADVYWSAMSPSLILLLGVPELQHCGAALPSYVHEVGPTMWDPPSSEDLRPSRLGVDRPAVLVSTSNLWRQDAEIIRFAAEALAGEEVDVVVTLPAIHELPTLPENFRLTAYFPHGVLMPRVSAVVCSAGFGTVTRSACAGVPCVVVPFGGDGPFVARAVGRTGIGLVLKPSELSTDRLRTAVWRALEDPVLRRAARRIQEKAVNYNASRHAADLIDGLLADSCPGRAASGRFV